jgi:hypothetical protein
MMSEEKKILSKRDEILQDQDERKSFGSKNRKQVPQFDNKTIAVRNEICGASGCDKHASRRVSFSIGFSANFCIECARSLSGQNMGLEEVTSLEC